MIARRTMFRAAAAVGASGVVAACGGEGGESKPEPDAPPVAVLSAEPADGSEDVGVLDDITVSVTDGTLTEVALTNADGKQVAGELSDDKRTWRASEPLGFAKTYTLTASATGTDDKPVELSSGFATVVPASTNRAVVSPDETTVGVAMPISVRFDEPVTDRAAAESALTVTTSNDVDGSWGWLHDKQVDWRPREYWPSGTEVKVDAKLYGADYGVGSYGAADVDTSFTIGRNQVVKIHTPDPEMRVYRDGELVKTYPASHGRDDDINLNTPNGTMIVMSKAPEAYFNNEEYGYTDVNKKWAVRFSNHGEFIHENEENRANIGKRNTSHGCVNLYEDDAKHYYDSAMIGDPVEVTGSRLDMPTTSDVNDWLFSWEQWRSMSALS